MLCGVFVVCVLRTTRWHHARKLFSFNCCCRQFAACCLVDKEEGVPCGTRVADGRVCGQGTYHAGFPHRVAASNVSPAHEADTCEVWPEVTLSNPTLFRQTSLVFEMSHPLQPYVWPAKASTSLKKEKKYQKWCCVILDSDLFWDFHTWHLEGERRIFKLSLHSGKKDSSYISWECRRRKREGWIGE